MSPLVPLVALFSLLAQGTVARAVDARLDTVLAEWAWLDVDANLAIIPCGQENAGYWAPLHEIFICQELIDHQGPDVVRFVVSHELAHAFMDQHRVPSVNEEAAADELATLVLLDNSQDEVYSGASWLLDQADDPTGEHPPGLDRARSILCLADGHSKKPSVPFCKGYYNSAKDSWTRVIAITRFHG